MDELREQIKAQIKLCEDEGWFPDDDSKKQGYLEALNDILEWMED